VERLLSELQSEHREWVDRNFPDETLQQAVLGVAEEAGELAHHCLKREQRIRRNEDHVLGMLDAVADSIIYCMSVADHLGVNLGELVTVTWDQVKQRDWVTNPEKGVPA
jgi:NTP pyrophosphatase (non-canonical NTP hydrolase)